MGTNKTKNMNIIKTKNRRGKNKNKRITRKRRGGFSFSNPFNKPADAPGSGSVTSSVSAPVSAPGTNVFNEQFTTKSGSEVSQVQKRDNDDKKKVWLH